MFLSCKNCTKLKLVLLPFEFQVSSRVINCLVCKHFAVASASPVCLVVLVAWTLSETIRYPYYLTNLLNAKVPLLTWLRYSAFIILYPVGGLGEALLTGLVLWHHPPFPTPPNLATLFLFTCPVSSAYWMFSTLGIKLYRHMLAQRRKMLYKSDE